LITRLVGTTHGRGRHEFPHVGSQLGLAGLAAQAATALFDEAEWELILERTAQVWGVWGCAYLEAVLRAADGVVSGRGA
jgi:CRISPR-associated endonuclease/helicase Cas3